MCLLLVPKVAGKRSNYFWWPAKSEASIAKEEGN